MKIPFLLTALIFLSCQDATISSLSQQACNFISKIDANDGIKDKTEQELMKYCFENRLNTISEISRNLIGKWSLIGYAEGNFINVTQPCAYIIINKDSLKFIFQGEYYKANSTHSWKIERNSMDDYPTLVVTPSEGFLRFFVFCDEYMFYDNTGVDGRMFLYEKVK